ncbi:MAG TPA: squalene--hopene cyclase, partial [Pirellulales bacterium]|nr:squalene--hopene cyclase [Pirellulales bacterium]
SVVGWQMMALRSAQMAYLEVPQETFLKAARFLNSVQQAPSVGLYGYMPGTHPSHVMTAEGLLCRQYSGWRRNHPVLINGVSWLGANELPRADRANMYFWYYGTQVMHHMGGEAWDKWNDALRDLLISLQSGGGHEAGSWAPPGGHDSQGGRLYTTALAACTLEVYYRHLPLYRGAATADAEPTPRRKR